MDGIRIIKRPIADSGFDRLAKDFDVKFRIGFSKSRIDITKRNVAIDPVAPFAGRDRADHLAIRHNAGTAMGRGLRMINHELSPVSGPGLWPAAPARRSCR